VHAYYASASQVTLPPTYNLFGIQFGPYPTTVTTLSVPAGTYLVQAKGTFFNTDESEVFGYCQILVGSNEYDSADALIAPNHPTDVTVGDLTTITLGSPATISYVCTNQDTATMYFDDAQMTATLINSLN
jgi:hypothetical protein